MVLEIISGKIWNNYDRFLSHFDDVTDLGLVLVLVLVSRGKQKLNIYKILLF